ncbi:putative copper-fist [Lyophyllum shimeji]|uniref:Copper-fist n=1 Tax=Lyophyllum shimeji TaxID=47721 RepID=A0A9P3PJH1_LYOSH|nr:putative copper-fist [Lyophyllum shimeji]
MVYVNSKKFACESCIKGHRSSSCHHTDRPLFEIKKKGRPVSQCQKCRELRQAKRVHSKCTCNEKEDSVTPGESSKTPLGTKPKRFIPIVPALPNGLQDVLKGSRISTSLPADARQRVDSLLNPCNCRSLWKCKCRTSESPTARSQQNGLDALILAAEMFDKEASTSVTNTPSPRSTSKRISSRPSSPSNQTSHKRTKHVKLDSSSPGPHLAPIFLDTLSPSTSSPLPPIPKFETMPSMSTITSLAGSGCTCGVQCACPGCIEHRGPSHASKERRNCADGCGTCVDHTSGIALPGSTASSSTTNILDRFFARAAALPAPPANRRMGVGVELDPMNVMVYPEAALVATERALAFGLVTIPKLECCGGRCGCGEGMCGCGKACDGCCQDHLASAARAEEKRAATAVEVRSPIPQESLPVAPVRSCCAGKAAVAA